MNKRIRALLLAGLLTASLCCNAAALLVEPSTNKITASEKAKTISFSVYVSADDPYAGAEFALGTSNKSLKFDSISYAKDLHHTHEIIKDGVLHFGYFTDDNTHAPDHTRVATVTYRYIGDNKSYINLLEGQLHTIGADGKTVTTKDTDDLFSIRVTREEDSRPSTGGSSSDKNDKDDKDEQPETVKPPFFFDVTNHWAKDHIYDAVEQGLFKGVSATEFAPNASVTRGMFVTVLSRIAQADHRTITKFVDVAPDAYYAKPVAWAFENGIVKGMSDTEFAPNAPITREQMAVMLANYAKYEKKTLPKYNIATNFADGNTISTWATDAVSKLQMAGVINGRDTGSFDPKATATRAEAATVFMRFVGLL